MEELFPIASGLLVGALLGAIRPKLRLLVGVALAVALGVLATVVSGEFRLSWAYLAIDIPLVAVSAAIGFLAANGSGRWSARPRVRSAPARHGTLHEGHACGQAPRHGRRWTRPGDRPPDTSPLDTSRGRAPETGRERTRLPW